MYENPPFYSRSYFENMDGMPAMEYLKTVKGQLKNVRDFKLRDTRIIGAGETITQGVYEFFQKPIGQSEATLGGGATIANKTSDLTNLKEANKLSNGNILIVESVQVNVFAPIREYATITNGRVTSAAPAAAGTTAAANNLIALCRGSYLTGIYANNNIRYEGRLWDFPGDAKLSGAIGGADDDGWVQVGDGKPRLMREIIIMKGGDFFQAKLEFPVDLTIAQNIDVELCLSGILVESVS